jgi:hypothetical protein
MILMPMVKLDPPPVILEEDRLDENGSPQFEMLITDK